MRIYMTLLVLTLMVGGTPGGRLAAWQTSNASAKTESAAGKSIGFRLDQWKTAHYHDSQKADQTEQTLIRIGFEVQRTAHDGHIDIRYRCPNWQKMTVNSGQQVAQWNQWLTEQGIPTVILEPGDSMKLVTVHYQLQRAARVPVRNQDEANSTCQMLNILGCAAEPSESNGQIVIEYSCPEWKTIGCPNCGMAHQWQDWLKQHGFATRHQH